MTYDLDGDGKVGAQDMVISRLFDKNNDGRLDEGEIMEAQTALKEGLMEKFQ